MRAYVLYENADWMPPLRQALEAEGVPFDEWFIGPGFVDLAGEPPPGVFLNRMSPSSHTRGHAESIALTKQILHWLEACGRRVINGTRAFALEVSKVAQYTALQRHGLRTPHTVAVAGGVPALRAAVRNIDCPFITKHNCGGKGLGVQLFRSYESFDEYITSPRFVESPDQITLLQEYVEPREPFITRVELVDGAFQYAIQVDTSRGFQLCPAEACSVEEAFCPAGEAAAAPADTSGNRQNLFRLREGFDHAIIAQYARFAAEQGIDLAGFEFIEAQDGACITYDINGTTNYSPAVEQQHGLSGMRAVAQLVKRELADAITRAGCQ
ncbi:MAG: alpha-L-glutamate ligase [Deltaproteobacteria bacterium]|nr:alpha-L-glutamate ligase [Deltaproteobacteria bacterium]